MLKEKNQYCCFPSFKAPVTRSRQYFYFWSPDHMVTGCFHTEGPWPKTSTFKLFCHNIVLGKVSKPLSHCHGFFCMLSSPPHTATAVHVGSQAPVTYSCLLYHVTPLAADTPFQTFLQSCVHGKFSSPVHTVKDVYNVFKPSSHCHSALSPSMLEKSMKKVHSNI